MTTTIEYDDTRPRPQARRAVWYLLLSMPIGIFWFVVLVTLSVVGLGTTIIWVGVPLLMLAAVLCRSAAILERHWINTTLSTYISSPYRPLPRGFKAYWRARLTEPATWRDLAYFLILLPLSVLEFAVTVALWSLGLGLTASPVYYRYLPQEQWQPFATDHPWVTVDSTIEALPWAAAGLLLLGVAVLVTRALARTHAVFARNLLGPSTNADRPRQAPSEVSRA